MGVADRRAVVLLATMVAIGFATDPITSMPLYGRRGRRRRRPRRPYVRGFKPGRSSQRSSSSGSANSPRRERAAAAGMATLAAAIAAFGLSQVPAYAVGTLGGCRSRRFIVAITSVTT